LLNKDISIIVGTRPQIIKSQPIIHQLKKSKCEVNIINTGQHYDYLLSKRFFHELDIEKPSVNLGIGSGTQIQQISKIIVKLEKYLKKTQSKLVIVPSDTTSALASAIAVSKCGIKLAHLEAGTRSNQFYMAEEVNRSMIDHCSNLLFAPTKNCLQNLKLESIYGNSFFVGDTMHDLFLKFNKQYEFIEELTDPIKTVTIWETVIEDSLKKKTQIQKRNNSTLRLMCFLLGRLLRKITQF